MDSLISIAIGLGTGLVSGFISGWLVYRLTKYREKKYQIYYFWNNFLFDTLRHCDLFIPDETLKNISVVGGKNSEWHKAIYAILDDINPFQEERQLSDREERIFRNVVTALRELYKWQKKNHLNIKFEE